jgi:hypothetical protein
MRTQCTLWCKQEQPSQADRVHTSHRVAPRHHRTHDTLPQAPVARQPDSRSEHAGQSRAAAKGQGSKHLFNQACHWVAELQKEAEETTSGRADGEVVSSAPNMHDRDGLISSATTIIANTSWQ